MKTLKTVTLDLCNVTPLGILGDENTMRYSPRGRRVSKLMVHPLEIFSSKFDKKIIEMSEKCIFGDPTLFYKKQKKFFRQSER